MPDSNSSWHIHVGFHNHKNDLEGEGDFTVSSVFNATYPLLTSFTDSTLNGHTIYLSMLNPLNCKVGVNDFEFVAHEQFRPDSLVPRDDYQVTMTPVMVSMGHSSPNNVQPVNIGAGHYNGDVVFTMSGKWRILLLLKRNNVSVKDSAYFDVEF